MSSKQLCLRWTKFQTNILSAFESLQNTEDLADVTLTCDGISIKAHKFILSACSPYFRTIFKENPCSHPIVILNYVSYADLMAIINFMYHGEVTVTEDQLPSFLQTAMVLQVSGLMNNENSLPKKPQTPTKKSKILNTESNDSPLKKVKVSPKTNKMCEEGTMDINQCEVVEIDKMKTEDELEGTTNTDYDASDNVEVVVAEKETQGSILEAALELRDKPSSILERSLTAQAGKSPSTGSFCIDKICVLPDIPKTIFIPRKPPEMEADKRIAKTSESSNLSSYDYPPEFLQQRIKTEERDNLEIMLPEDVTLARNVDLQPHHSSQCGNCPHCGKVYSNQSALKYHVRLVHSDLTNMYCCHLCPEAFDYRESYKKHMAEVHMIRN